MGFQQSKNSLGKGVFTRLQTGQHVFEQHLSEVRPSCHCWFFFYLFQRHLNNIYTLFWCGLTYSKDTNECKKSIFTCMCVWSCANWDKAHLEKVLLSDTEYKSSLPALSLLCGNKISCRFCLLPSKLSATLIQVPLIYLFLRCSIPRLNDGTWVIPKFLFLSSILWLSFSYLSLQYYLPPAHQSPHGLELDHKEKLWGNAGF